MLWRDARRRYRFEGIIGASLALQRTLDMVERVIVKGEPLLRNRIDQVEAESIREALALASGNQSQAAATLGLARRTLLYKMQCHGIR